MLLVGVGFFTVVYTHLNCDEYEAECKVQAANAAAAHMTDDGEPGV